MVTALTYRNISEAEIVNSGVLTRKEMKWLSDLRIPFGDDTGLWQDKLALDRKITKALQDGLLTEVEPEASSYVPPRVQIISDSLGDVRNPVDGKVYDSKSAYHRKLKDAGCHVIESGNVAKRQDGDHNVRKELTQATREVLSRTGGKLK